MNINKGLKGLVMMSFALLVACVKIDSTQNIRINPHARFGMVVFANNTEIPQAGFKAMNMTSGILRAKGISSVEPYPHNPNCSKLITCPNTVPNIQQVLSWARNKQMTYVMAGSVNEWDYKVGLDGEPTVGLTMQVYQVQNGSIVWSSVGSKIGNSRSGLTVIAQRLMTQMLDSVKTH